MVENFSFRLNGELAVLSVLAAMKGGDAVAICKLDRVRTALVVKITILGSSFDVL